MATEAVVVVTVASPVVLARVEVDVAVAAMVRMLVGRSVVVGRCVGVGSFVVDATRVVVLDVCLRWSSSVLDGVLFEIASAVSVLVVVALGVVLTLVEVCDVEVGLPRQASRL
mmetsp:Transcript_37320/g.107148  ORF Transcript_37320/g.107148 Transcript_37320/m.107148 type:complete len:113 (+) Transcript_37320:94-432(+)